MMFDDIHRQLASSRAACKQWSVLASVASLVAGALGRFNTITLLWEAAPLILLALADAGYAARQAFLADHAEALQAHSSIIAVPPQPVLAGLRRFALAICSLSVWPFYLTLSGIFAASAFELPRYAPPPSNNATASVASAAAPAANNAPAYPPGVALRYPNGMPYTGSYLGFPGYPATPTRAPNPNLPHPATPASSVSKLPAHVQMTPPAVYYGTPAPRQGTPAPAPPVSGK